MTISWGGASFPAPAALTIHTVLGLGNLRCNCNEFALSLPMSPSGRIYHMPREGCSLPMLDIKWPHCYSRQETKHTLSPKQNLWLYSLGFYSLLISGSLNMRNTCQRSLTDTSKRLAFLTCRSFHIA